MPPGQEAKSDDSGSLFDFLHNNCMLSVLIRITSIRGFLRVHTTYNFTISEKTSLNVCFLDLS